MDVQRVVEEMVGELQDAISNGRTYIEELQQKMDDMESARDNLETYVGQAEEAVQALESIGDLDDALSEASNLVD